MLPFCRALAYSLSIFSQPRRSFGSQLEDYTLLVRSNRENACQPRYPRAPGLPQFTHLSFAIRSTRIRSCINFCVFLPISGYNLSFP